MINVLEMLENSAERFPDKTAFSDPDGSITFRELLTRAKKVATLLLNGSLSGCFQPESACAFYLEKSTEALPVMFGAVYAGGFYSFIDIRQPRERAEKVLEILDAAVIVTDEKNMEALGSVTEGSEAYRERTVLLSELMSMAENTETDEGLLKKAAESFYDLMPLYVNFTSGSTGIPKGVAVGHASVIDFIPEFCRVFGIDDTDIIANQAPFDFDVSVKDIYSGLYTGAEVRLIPREYFSNPTVLMDYLSDNRVTTLIWAVSAMCFVSIMNGFEYRTPDSVKRVMFSGELMPVKQLNKWRK